MKITKHQKTKIVPLRWIGNLFERFASNHLMAVVYLDEDGKYGLKYRYHAFLWKYLNKPYELWGTYYMIDLNAMKKAWDEDGTNELLDRLGSDYDENGIPYWDK